MSVEASAKASGISDRQAHRWLKLPHVQQAVLEAKHAVFDEALDRLRQGTSVAIRVLLEQMTSDLSRPYVKVQAATAWLNFALEIHKMSDLESKVNELENLLKERT